jgi:4-diphosphocytidyl-2-C-methyl-D-erythritol kinase
MQQPATLVRHAHAKVNLALGVGAPLPPGSAFAGYHPIASWMASITLADDVEMERIEGESRFEIAWADDAPRPSPIDWPLEKDLGVRAHRLLEQEAGRPLPVRVRVRKRVPVGGGLGGGSADAAAVLLGVRDLFALRVTNERLAAISTKLGSDVAFFLDDRTPARPAIVSNLGDRIERVTPVAQRVVLFFPAFGCPTGPVYKAFDSGDSGAGFESRAARIRSMVVQAARDGVIRTDDLFNDLAGPACRVEPRLREVIDRLAGTLNARIHVTGSGSTLFALAGSAEQTRRMVEVTAEIRGVSAIATELV